MPVPRAALIALAAVLVAALCPPSALAQSTGDAYYEFLMARRLEGEGDAAGALAALNRAAAADRASAEIRAEIASFQLRHNRRDEAVKAANEALAVDDANIEAHRVLGLVNAANADDLVEKRQIPQGMNAAKEAIAHLERVSPSLSADLTLHFTLGRLYLSTGAADKAVQAFSRVLSQNPNSMQGRLALAQAYAASDDLNAAIGTLEEVVEDEPRIAASLAQYQEQVGAYKEAAASYTMALAVVPTSRELKMRRVTALINAKEFGTAAAMAAAAQQEHPEDGRFPRLQARALVAGGDTAGAATVLEAAVRAFPKDPQMPFALADLYSDSKRPDEAERTIRQMITGAPANADALNYLGYMLAERGEKLDEAVRLVRRALDIEPDNPSFLDSLGWAYFRKGDFDDALKYLAPAAEKLPTNAVIQDHFGDALARRNRWQDAIAAWKKAVDGEGDLDRAAIERKIQDAQRRLAR